MSARVYRIGILVDLKNVTCIDSCGVGGLVAMFLHVLKRGGELKVICPSQRACRVLKITQLRSVFDVFQTEAQGIASFRTPVGVTPRPGGN